MRIVVDEDLPLAVAQLLRESGFEAKHVRELGLAGQPDSNVIAAAREKTALLFTADLHFSNLLTYPLGTHSGVVVLRFPDYFRRAEIVQLVRRFVGEVDLGDIQGCLVVVDPRSFRIRRNGERL